MQKIIKKGLSFLTILCLLFAMFSVNTLALGSASITLSSDQLMFGDDLTVTLRVTTYSFDYMKTVQGYLIYDSNVLEFVSGENCQRLTDGKLKISIEVEDSLNITEQIQFKAKSAGSSIISVENLSYCDSDNRWIDINGKTTSVSVVNLDPSLSANASIISLKVSTGKLSPSFSPNITAYEVVVPNEETEVFLAIRLSDSKASYVVEGSEDMIVGFNKRTIKVTAENGTVKSYTINVIRLDEEGKRPNVSANTADSFVVGGQTLFIENELGEEIIPAGFKVENFAYEGKEYPVLVNNSIALIYLVNASRTEGDFYLITKEASLEKAFACNIGGSAYTVLPAPADAYPDGFTPAIITLDGVEVNAYKSPRKDFSDFAFFYACSESGFAGMYRLDMKDNTIQRAVGVDLGEDDLALDYEQNQGVLNNIRNLSTNAKIVAVIIILGMLGLVASVVILIVKIVGSVNKKTKDDDFDDDDCVGFEYVMLDKPQNKK